MDKKVPTESLLQFYQRTGCAIPEDLLNNAASGGHFNVRSARMPIRKTPFNRRDYYKICLSINKGKGEGLLVYDDREIKLGQPCLICTNPTVPASIEISYEETIRHSCLFDKQFIEGIIPPDIQYASPLFNPSLHPVIHLTEEQGARFVSYFTEMQSLQQSSYAFKRDMIRNILQLLIHETIRLQQQQVPQSAMVKDRLVTSFFSLLNQQFPIDSPEHSLKLLSPSHFADKLHVHVNHLNSVVKKHSGKSTRTIIHERVVAESKALLRNTNWNIAEIAYALGFEYPSHFNKYFKQFTGQSPMAFRMPVEPVMADI